MNRKQRRVDIAHLGVIDLAGIENRNEKRVLACMPQVLEEYPDFDPNAVDIQDIYALSLNSLPPRYTQAFSIVLQEPVGEDRVWEAVREAVQRVRTQPK